MNVPLIQRRSSLCWFQTRQALSSFLYHKYTLLIIQLCNLLREIDTFCGDAFTLPGSILLSIVFTICNQNLLIIVNLTLLLSCGDAHKNPGPGLSHSHSLSCSHIIARSLLKLGHDHLQSNGKLNGIQTICAKHFEYHFISLTETWLNPNMSDVVINIDHYFVERKEGNRHSIAIA